MKFAVLRDHLHTQPHTLAELRTHCQITQASLGEALGWTQSQVSRLERQDDALVSTVDAYVAATGGHLRLIADYGDHAITIVLVA